MLKNYIKVAIRNILKHKTFSFINIFGLAVAMAVCMAIIMLVADQMMNDRHNPNSARIYRINTVPFYDGRLDHRGNETATSPLPLKDELLTDNTNIEMAGRLVRGFGNLWLEFEPGHDINIPVSGYFADPEVLEIFDHELLYGDPKTALVEPYSVVLTKEAAEKLFEQENPLGELLKVGDIGTYKVTGVIRKTDNKSHIVSEAYASFSTIGSLEAIGKQPKRLDDWYDFYHSWLYVMLKDDVTAEQLQTDLDQIYKNHYTELPTPETIGATFTAQHLLGITPGPLVNNPIGPFMPWVIIYFVAGLAGVVLVTSCFNFTNLSVARSLSRAREIGVRKATGALRIQIFMQFISESIVIALLALVLSFGMLVLLKPVMLDLAFTKALRWDMSANFVVYGVFLLFAVLVGVLAGLFPAGVLSGFQPVKVLKNLGNSKVMSKVGLRKALLVVQFTFSMIFILTVIVLYNQLNLFLHSDYGFNPKQKIVIQKGGENYLALKNELLKQNNIESVSLASHVPNAGVVFGSDFKKSLEDKEWTDINYFAVDTDYLTNMEIPLVAGKFFDPASGESNSNFMVINEASLNALHYDTPLDAIGQALIDKRDSTERRIIGVFKNFVHEMASETLDPLALLYSPNEFNMMQIQYSGNFDEASTSVEKVWAKVNPDVKLEIKDFEQEINEMHDILFGTLVKVLGFVATIAVIISCLGLLGMATYTIETRRKEIAVRKILGSSNSSLIYILSRGYLMILLMAALIAVPAAYFINTLWLENFAFHVTVDFWTITTGIVILGFFGIFTICSQTLQAIFVNPVENLKVE